ncbi:hypothetical protein [Burkholderia sp. TSV86]|uniref:hypothetical protein n=1 Tax=Burkholderia sp. TSV86 TaxID=1385594 RepID=UPI0018D20F27|nr:hypothetical protein [Burkholderia sp. TSV86]
MAVRFHQRMRLAAARLPTQAACGLRADGVSPAPAKLLRNDATILPFLPARLPDEASRTAAPAFLRGPAPAAPRGAPRLRLHSEVVCAARLAGEPAALDVPPRFLSETPLCPILLPSLSTRRSTNSALPPRF